MALDFLGTQDIGPIFWILLASAGIILYYKGDTRYLRHIPTVGSDLPFLSLKNACKFQFSIAELIAEGVKRYPGAIFKVPDFSQWIVIVTGERNIEEYLKIPESTFSSLEALDAAFQLEHTFDPYIVHSPRKHVEVVRTRLSRNIPRFVEDMYEETARCLVEVFPTNATEWTSVKQTQELVTRIIAQATNRIFVGASSCRNPEFIDLTSRRTMAVFKTAMILRTVPAPLRRFVNSLMPINRKQINRVTEILEPIIQARREELLNNGDGPNARHSDMLTYLIDGAEGVDAESRTLALRVLLLNFASLHTTSVTLTNALYDLAAYSCYMEPLREEIQAVIQVHGWSKEGLDQMHKVGSFIKESQRLHATGALLMLRYALKDYTFSDGTYIPRGTRIAVATGPVHYNEGIYTNAAKFDGFRFSGGRTNLSGDKKHNISSTSPGFLAFGHGLHACPGRFFVAYELKLLFALIVVGYDMKMSVEGFRPNNVTVKGASFPDGNCSVMIRRRP